jgi:hypothetical protein
MGNEEKEGRNGRGPERWSARRKADAVVEHVADQMVEAIEQVVATTDCGAVATLPALRDAVPAIEDAPPAREPLRCITGLRTAPPITVWRTECCLGWPRSSRGS